MDKPLRQPRKLKLYKALKIGGIRDERKQAQALKRFGYVLDRDLTNMERFVAFNPSSHKVLFFERGTDPSNIGDLATDVVLATGGIKNTVRYDNAVKAMEAAHKKYAGNKFIDIGYSLGGNIVNYAGKSTDDIYAINAGFSPFEKKARENVVGIRVAGDPISAFAPSANTTTIASTPTAVPLGQHYIPQLKDVPVFL